MAKLFVTFGILFLALYVNARPSDSDDGDQTAVKSNPFANDPFFKDSDFSKPKFNIANFKPLTEQDIKDIKPVKNGSAKGFFYSSSSSKKVENGQVVQDEHSEKGLVNDNGKTQEYENSN